MGPQATRGKERALPPSNPSSAHEAHRIHDPSRAPRGQRPPVPLRLHPGALRRVLALAEGRRAVHRRPPRRGGLPDGGGARAPREHLVARPSCASRRRSASRASPSCRRRRARSTGARVAAGQVGGGASAQPLFSLDQNEFETAHRGRPRQRRGDGPQGVAHRRRGGVEAISESGRVLVVGTDQMAFFASYLRHLLMLLDVQADIVVSPSQEALEPPRAHRRGHARHRPLRRPPAPARRPRDEDRPPPQGARRSPSPTRRCPRSPSSRRSSSTTRRTRPAYVRSHTALLSIIQALAYGVYARDTEQYADRIKAFRLK